MPTVSVVIPTYNGERFVGEAVDSVFAQTYADYEVIVVDDGSTDGTERLLAPLIAAGRLRYLTQVNSGVASARNLGLAVARGEFICFLDHDDWLPHDSLAWQVGLLKPNPEVGLVYGGFVMVRRSGERTEHVPASQPSGMVYNQLRLENRFMSGAALMRTAALREVGGFDTSLRFSQDWDAWLRLSRKVAFLYEPRIGLYYRQHSTNGTTAVFAHLRCHLRVARKHIGWNLPLFLKHLRRVSGYFVWHLSDFAREKRRKRDYASSLKAYACILLLRPGHLRKRGFFVRVLKTAVRAAQAALWGRAAVTRRATGQGRRHRSE